MRYIDLEEIGKFANYVNENNYIVNENLLLHNYFQDITDINTLSRRRERNEEELMEDLLPFGSQDDGVEQMEIIEGANREWLLDGEEERFF